MKWILLVMAGATVALFALGYYTDATGRSEDEKVGSAFFYLGALAVGTMLAVTAIVYAVVRSTP